MQVYIHKDGNNYGPYNLDQIRRYLKAGNFTCNDHACHDGTNWIKLSDVPGISSKPVADAKQVAQTGLKEEKKLPRGKLIIVSVSVFALLALIAVSISLLANHLFSGDEDGIASPEASKENLFILSPEQVVDVYDGDTFKIDLPNMHPLFGDNLSIRLYGVDTPEMRGTTDEVKELAKQAQKLTEKALKGASKIELKNPQRGKYFRIVSEVWIDGESLADLLKAKGLAKDYDGEGARPDW